MPPLDSLTTLLYFDEDSGDFVGSSNRRIYYQFNNQESNFLLPFTLFDLFSFSRLLSRLFRIDRVNLISISRDKLTFLRQFNLYSYDLNTKKIEFLKRLESTRNILMDSSARDGMGNIIFGDYGGSGKVKIYKSSNDGFTWKEAYIFNENTVKQVLNIFWDNFSESFLVCTGDEQGECFFYIFDSQMELKEIIGDGSLKYRSISVFFEQNSIKWVTNDPYNGSKIYSMERSSYKTNLINSIDGSIWYSKLLKSKTIMLSSCAENTDDYNSKYIKIYSSLDFINWNLVKVFKKDIYPKKLFRFGLASFPKGSFSGKSLYINAEGISQHDGKVLKLEIQ